MLKLHKEIDRPKNYFGKERFVLKILGLSLTGNESRTYRIYSFFFLLLVNYTYPILDIGDVFKHDFSVIADILIYQFACFIGMAKTTVILRNRIRFGKLLNRLEEPPFIANPKRGGAVEDKLIRKCVLFTNIQILIYWTVVSLSIIFGIIYTFIKRVRYDDYHYWEFPYGPFTVINTTYSPNFEISWFYQSISVACIGYHFTTIDLITASVLCHVSVQFKVLQNHLRRMVSNARQEMLLMKAHNQGITTPVLDDGSQEVPWTYLKSSLETAVHYHLEIINLIKEMEEVLSVLFLLVFLGTLGMLGFLVYHTSTLPLDDVRLIRTSAEVASACLQIFTVCYWGEQVMYESQQVGRAAYECDFVGTDLRFQKALVIIMRRSRDPCKLTAGKFTDICLSTFTWLLRTSYSTFMVLRKNNSGKFRR